MLTRDDIQAEYEQLGYKHGWTFMACPEEQLRTATVAIVGTNPSVNEIHSYKSSARSGQPPPPSSQPKLT